MQTEKEIFQQIEFFYTPTPTQVIITILFIVFLIAAYIVLQSFYKKRTQKEIQEIKRRSFKKKCRSNGLTAEETEFMFNTVRMSRVKRKMDVIEKINVFDEFADDYLNEIEDIKELEEEAEYFGAIRDKLKMNRYPDERIIRSTRAIPPGIEMVFSLEVNERAHNFRGLVDAIDDKAIYCSFELGIPKRELFTVGRELTVRFIYDSRYTVKTTIISSSTMYGFRLLLKHTRNIERNQLRSFKRFPLDGKIYFSLFTPKEYERKDETIKKLTKRNFLPAQFRDLSAGGASFYSDNQFNYKQIVYLHFYLDGDYNVFGEVMRSSLDKKRFKFLLQVKFLDITENLQNRIHQFLTKRELAERQRKQEESK